MDKLCLDIDALYTPTQEQEIIRVWKANPAKGRIPKTLAGKVRALRKRGVPINAPPFGHSASELTDTIVSGNIASDAHNDWRNELISKSLLKADMAAGQSASASSKRAKSEALIVQYKQAHNLKEGIKPSAALVADWAIEQGLALPCDRRNLIKRLRTTKLVT